MLKKAIVILLCIVFMLTGLMLTACKPKVTEDISFDEGNIKPPASGATQVTFWGWGDREEVAVFTRIVNEFNKKYKGIIEINYVQKPSSSYGTSMLTTLAGSKTPDVFYVQDNYFKQYASLGYLLDITEYYNKSKVLDENDMFPHTISRYRYNPTTTTSYDNDPLYGVPKDLAPTVLYYNKSHFAKAGVTIISMTEEEALEAGYTVKGFDSKTKVFNNQIPMSWSEVVELAKLLMSSKASQYGYFTEWWFNYGWSVGGDCLEYIPTDDPQYNGGYYIFTLQDSTKNYIVKDDCDEGITVNGNHYNAGEIISYNDKMKLTAEQKSKCNVLPSMREAFTEFVRLSHKPNQLVDNVKNVYENVNDFYGADENGNIYGYGITPNPNTIASDGKVGYFTSGKLGMLVTTRSAVRQIRNNMKDDWDVAPLPMYKEYSEDGKTVINHGIQAAHSGSVAICISAKTKVPNAAYVFAEFIASPEGQAIQAEEGFAIPLQVSIANSDVFLQPDKKPQNSKIFIDACYYERPGDWWYLKDKKWIDDWASFLNGDVRNGVATLTQFYADWVAITNIKLLAYTRK